LVLSNGMACGILEDTRRGKRLYDQSGQEMLSAHLSSFAYATPLDAAEFLKGAAVLATRYGLGALFCSVPASLAPGLLSRLPDVDVVAAGAHVYGIGLRAGIDWWPDTAEI